MCKSRQFVSIFAILVITTTPAIFAQGLGPDSGRPNVLLAISDDQSYPYASIYGEPQLSTPAFDAVARNGILFHNAFTPCPGCSPMRAALLSGQHVWQIREAGTHASSFPRELKCFTGELAERGYHVGYTGKPWGPGNWAVSGWTQNPVGPAYNKLQIDAPEGISRTDYAANFESFLDERSPDQPFCFWYGGHEPHRSFGNGLGIAAGKDPAQVRVPKFLPDSTEIRSDLLDYFYEIEWFDSHLDRMLASLKSRGLLENTLVVVTSDNGMSFPRAKANLYEYGIHMPLAISWPAAIKNKGRDCVDLVSLLDVTATIYDVCRLPPPADQPLSGKSLKPLLAGEQFEASEAVFAGRERHSSSRFNSLGYPCRCVRTDQYLYIRNFAPERWPAGSPRKYSSVTYDRQGQPIKFQLGPVDGGYHDIDACPTLTWMIKHRSLSGVNELLEAAVAIRPAEELYNVKLDPACLSNLLDHSDDAVEQQLSRHRKLLDDELAATGDLRHLDFPASQVWEQYPRYSSLRWFPAPEWAQKSPESAPSQAWLEQQRPQENR
ncbi:MAG: sulfatase [Planctomycetales bacterium]|nr:sulfatase [Planctomycetales bacterium]